MQGRSHYHADLDRVWDSLQELAELARTAMIGASTAIAEADLGLAEQVISDDIRLDVQRAQLEELVFTLLATQQPVAGDLRLLTAAIPAGAALERMGDLAAHIAGAARLRYPDNAVPTPLRETIAQMGSIAAELAGDVATAITTRDGALAAQVPARDDTMDGLHRQMFRMLLASASHTPVNTAIDLSLLGRYYERYADQAVSVARRIYFILTAERLPARNE